MLWQPSSLFVILATITIPCIRCRVHGIEGQNSSSISKLGYQYTSYNLGIICNAAQPAFQPKSLPEIQEIVTTALRNGYFIKPVGNLHTATDIICTDGVPLTMSKIKHFKYDSTTGYATVGAGATLGYFLRRLHKNGRTIYGIPTYLDITIGGALGTGAHGTNLQNPATPSDQVVSLVVVDGLGNVRNVKNLEILQAFRTNLGLLGVIYEVTFSTIPQYKLHIQNYPQSDSILWQENEIINMARSSERFQFYWFPTIRKIVMSVGHRLPVSIPGNCQTYFISEGPRSASEPLSQALEAMQEDNNNLGYFTMQSISKLSLYQNVPGRSPIFTKDGKTLCEPAIGYSHRMSGNRCKECPWANGQNSSLLEFGVAVVIPLSEFQGALKTMRTILEEYPMEFPFGGIYFRFLSPSDGLLTVNSERATVAIEWVLVPRVDRFGKPMLGLSTSQALLQDLVIKHQGRPHWGKNGPLYFQQPLLLKRYPKLPTFIQRMEEFDPRGVFMNDFGRRLRFGLTKSSLDPYLKYCGLADACNCQNDNDCGDGGPSSYLCGVIHGYHVCRERGDHYKVFKESVTRKLISLVTKQK